MELFGKPLHQIRKLIQDGEITSKEVVQYFLKRSKDLNGDINGYITVVEEPDSADEGSFLAGVPLAVKDNFCTNGVRTTAASKVLEDFIPQYDSTVTARIKESGGVVIGKTNMDAWAHGSSSETSDFGPVRNPWDLERAPGGSSGGSAAVVGAYMAPAAIGSETAGSIRLPAAWCGVYGFKPTYGRVSRYGVVAMGSSLDSPGPITTNVEDAALLLGVIAGKDPYDATSIDVPVEDYTKSMKEKKTFRIGVPKQYFYGSEDAVKERVEEGIKELEKMGHKIVEIELMDPKYAISVYTIIQRAEVSSNLARYQGNRYGKGREVFGAEAKKRIMLGTYVLSHGYQGQYYVKAQKAKTLIIEDFKRAFKEVDLIVGPCTPITALKLGEFKNYPFFGEVMDQLLEPSSIAGLPAASIPVGVDSNGLPIGMQVIGNYVRECDVLALSYQFEQETDYFGVIKKGLEKWK